jgi:2-methylcitrate dehydratase PrpD
VTSRTGISSPDGALDFLIGEAIRVFRSPLPDDVAEIASQAILDIVSTGLAGSVDTIATVSRRALLQPGSAGVWGTADRADPVTAALLNGIAAHVLDYDDWVPGSGAHPSVSIVPALLAAASVRAVSGEQLLAAYVAAFELQERVGLSISPSHYDIGFHTTGIIGALGAACAASLVLSDDPERLRCAVALAATGAAGLKSVFGSAGKALNAGQSAANGMRAALLADAGIESPSADTVFGPQGFAPTHSTAVDIRSLSEPFGAPWYSLTLLFKFSPACFGTHGAILAANELRLRGIDPDQLESLDVTVPPITRAVCSIPDPQNGLEGKFSLSFTTAAALEGLVTTASFADPFLVSATTKRLLHATRLTYDDSFAKTRAVVIAHGLDGSIHRAEADAGVPQWSKHPNEQRELLLEKARELGTDALGMAGQARLVEAVFGLTAGGSIHPLLDAIAAAGSRDQTLSASGAGVTGR